jgi:hypothetical protein
MAMLRGMGVSSGVRRAYAAAAATRNGSRAIARHPPHVAGAPPSRRRRRARGARCNAAMPAEKPMPQHTDPDAELHASEPLRIAFAIGAFALGLIAALHG